MKNFYSFHKKPPQALLSPYSGYKDKNIIVLSGKVSSFSWINTNQIKLSQPWSSAAWIKISEKTRGLKTHPTNWIPAYAGMTFTFIIEYTINSVISSKIFLDIKNRWCTFYGIVILAETRSNEPVTCYAPYADDDNPEQIIRLLHLLILYPWPKSCRQIYYCMHIRKRLNC